MSAEHTEKRRLSRRDFLMLSAAGAGSVVLVACGATPEPQTIVQTVEVPKVVKETVQVESTVQVEKTVEVVREVTPTPGPHVTLWMSKLFIDAFNQYLVDTVSLTSANNNFTGEVVFLPSGERDQKIMAAIQGGTLPDMVLLNLGVPMYHKMGLMVDVSDVYEETAKLGGGFYDSMVGEVTFGGKQFGVPFSNEMNLMYYRQDLFEAAGYTLPFKDLNEYVTACKAVTNPANKIWGWGGPISMTPDATSNYQIFSFAFGGYLQDNDGNIAVNTPENLQALEWFTGLYTKEKIEPDAVTGWDDTGNNKAYLAGQCATIINTLSVVNSMRTNDPGWLKSTWLGPVPAGPNGPKALSSAYQLGIFNTSTSVDYAKLIIKGIMEPGRYMTALKVAGGYMFPSLQSFAQDPFFTDDPWNSETSEAMKVGESSSSPGEPQAWIAEVRTTNLLAQMTSRVVVDGWDPQKALSDLEQQCIVIKAKYDNLG